MADDLRKPSRRKKPLNTGTKYEIFPEDVLHPIQPRAWGVQAVTQRDGGQVPFIAVVYEPDLHKETAQEIANLLNQGIDWDWEQTCDELVRRGFDVSIPPHLLPVPDAEKLTCHEPGKAAIALSSTTHILHSALYRGESQIVLAVQDRIHPGDFLIIQTDVGSYNRVAGNINNRHGAKENEALIELRS